LATALQSTQEMRAEFDKLQTTQLATALQSTQEMRAEFDKLRTTLRKQALLNSLRHANLLGESGVFKAVTITEPCFRSNPSICADTPSPELHQPGCVEVCFGIAVPGKEFFVAPALKMMAVILDQQQPWASDGQALVVDVGLEFGTETLVASAMGYSTLSFEVSPLMYNFVQEMVKFNQFSKAQVLNAGAGATEKTMFLHDRTLSHGTEGSYVNDVSESVDGEPVVEMHQYRLDGLVADDVMLMKIDCEGCEGGALRGAEKLFEAKRVKFVVVEIFPELLGYSDTDGKVVSKGMGISDTASTLKYLMVTHGFKCLWERNGLMFGHDIDGSINQLVASASRVSGNRQFPDDGVAEGLLDNLWCAMNDHLYKQMADSFEALIYADARARASRKGCQLCINCIQNTCIPLVK